MRRRALGDTRPHTIRPVVVRCMSCQIRTERAFGNRRAVETLINREMDQRVTAWLRRKGLT